MLVSLPKSGQLKLRGLVDPKVLGPDFLLRPLQFAFANGLQEEFRYAGLRNDDADLVKAVLNVLQRLFLVEETFLDPSRESSSSTTTRLL